MRTFTLKLKLESAVENVTKEMGYIPLPVGNNNEEWSTWQLHLYWHEEPCFHFVAHTVNLGQRKLVKLCRFDEVLCTHSYLLESSGSVELTCVYIANTTLRLTTFTVLLIPLTNLHTINRKRRAN